MSAGGAGLTCVAGTVAHPLLLVAPVVVPRTPPGSAPYSQAELPESCAVPHLVRRNVHSAQQQEERGPCQPRPRHIVLLVDERREEGHRRRPPPAAPDGRRPRSPVRHANFGPIAGNMIRRHGEGSTLAEEAGNERRLRSSRVSLGPSSSATPFYTSPPRQPALHIHTYIARQFKDRGMQEVKGAWCPSIGRVKRPAVPNVR